MMKKREIDFYVSINDEPSERVSIEFYWDEISDVLNTAEKELDRQIGDDEYTIVDWCWKS
jgi:hypothetical protein